MTLTSGYELKGYRYSTFDSQGYWKYDKSTIPMRLPTLIGYSEWLFLTRAVNSVDAYDGTSPYNI